MATSKKDIFHTFVFLLFAFFLQVVITSRLSTLIPDVNILADFLAFTQIVMIIAVYISLGFDLSVDKYVKWFIVHKKFNSLDHYISLYANIIIKSFALVGLIIALHYILIFSFPLLYRLFSGINYFYCNFVFIGVIAVILNTIYFTGRIIRCYLGSRYYVLIAQMLPFVFIFLGLTFIQHKLSKDDLYILALLYIASFALTAGIAFLVLRKISQKRIVIKYKPFDFKINNFVRTGFAFAKSDISAYIRYFLVPIADIVSYVKSTPYVAYVSTSIVLNIFIEILARTISAVVKPNVLLAYKQGRDAFIRNIYMLVLYVFLICVVYLFIIVLFGEQILVYLYGQSFESGYYILVLISFGAAIDLFVLPFRISLEILMTRLVARISLRISIITLVALVISGFIGVHAVCVVYLISRIVYSALMYMYFRLQINKPSSYLYAG